MHGRESCRLSDLDIPVVVYTSDLQWLQTQPLEKSKKDDISKLLQVAPGIVFCAKLAASTCLGKISAVSGAILQAVGEKALLPGLFSSLGEKGLRGLYDWLKGMLSTAKAGSIISGIAGVLIGHIAAPVYAFLGMHQAAVGPRGCSCGRRSSGVGRWSGRACSNCRWELGTGLRHWNCLSP
ncbi:unnamed protein product [Symbiodinium sp. CCMP2456]|nr:unnamed protein product [Symbiodinium sp. CCMP2456]